MKHSQIPLVLQRVVQRRSRRMKRSRKETEKVDSMSSSSSSSSSSTKSTSTRTRRSLFLEPLGDDTDMSSSSSSEDITNHHVILMNTPSRGCRRTASSTTMTNHNHVFPATPTPSPQKQVKKELRFDLSKNQVYAPPRTYLSSRDVGKAWLTQKDCDDALIVYRNAVKAVYLNNESSASDLLHVVCECNQSQSDSLEDMDGTSKKIPAGMRGMEADIIPMLKNARRRHCQAVLDCSSAIPTHLPADLRLRMLSARSMQYSRPFKIFARLQAKADARVLQEL